MKRENFKAPEQIKTGNVNINTTITGTGVYIKDLKVGDIIYEKVINGFIKCTVDKLPKKDNSGNWLISAIRETGEKTFWCVPEYKENLPIDGVFLL